MNKPVIAASNEHSGRLESAPPLEPVQAHGVLKSPAQPSVLADDAAEDSVWVERALNKDNDAFELLFNKYRQRVFSVAWRLLRDEDAALDVVQDAFVKAYEQLEKLRGDLNGAYSRRINIQHRLVYQVVEKEHAVKVLRMWTHYE